MRRPWPAPADPTWSSAGHRLSPTAAAPGDRLQPTADLRRLHPRVIAAAAQEVVVLWRQRGLGPSGDTLDSEVLGLYRVSDGKLARGQMFYFDPASVCAFLARASRAAPA